MPYVTNGRDPQPKASPRPAAVARESDRDSNKHNHSQHRQQPQPPRPVRHRRLPGLHAIEENGELEEQAHDSQTRPEERSVHFYVAGILYQESGAARNNGAVEIAPNARP